MRTLIITLILSVSLTACSSIGSNKSSKAESGSSAAQLYSKAKRNLDKKNYESAATTLETLEARYPFTPESVQGQLDSIFANYELGETDRVIKTAVDFISRNPQHPKADYAYYMIGLARFNQGKSALDRYLPTDLSKRDLGIAKTAFKDFAALIRVFPNSSYSADAKQRMIYLRNIMARYEINVANYYFKREAYLAAANRGKYVVEHFPKTPAIADALAVMTQAYNLLGMKQESNAAFAVLKSNFPKHPSIGKNGSFKLQLTQDQVQGGFISRIIGTPRAPQFDNRSKHER
ncbi:MAG: outer membrane protein assembly factor BamD [Pseudomonadota bacterium]